MAVYVECGGPEPRTDGCGKVTIFSSPEQIMQGLRGLQLGAECPGCGATMRMVPTQPPMIRQQRVQAASPMDAIRVQLEKAKAAGMSGLIGPNGNPLKRS